MSGRSNRELQGRALQKLSTRAPLWTGIKIIKLEFAKEKVSHQREYICKTRHCPDTTLGCRAPHHACCSCNEGQPLRISLIEWQWRDQRIRKTIKSSKDKKRSKKKAQS